MNGFPHRFGKLIHRLPAEEHDTEASPGRCFGLLLRDLNAHRLCRIGASRKVRPSLLLWGDSHADAILPALAVIVKRNAWKASRRPAELRPAPRRVAARRLSLQRLQCSHHAVRAVASADQDRDLRGTPEQNADGRASGEEGHGFVAIGDEIAVSHKPSEKAAILRRDIERTVDALRAAHRKLARRKDVTAYYPGRVFCRTGHCKVRVPGIPLYRDEHHLSVYGARKLEPMLASLFAASPSG